MYEKGDVKVGRKADTRTENYDHVDGVYLPHSCDSWVIGGKQQVLDMIEDLQEALKKL